MSVIDFKQMLLNNTEFLKPFAVTLTHDQEKAKDLMQETLFRALVNKEKYQIGTNIKAWLYTIMRNIFINEYRRRAKQNVIFDKTPNEYFINSSKNAVPNDALTQIGEKELWTAIEKLPDIFKKPFLMYFHGFKYQDIAIETSEPLGTIKSRIHFARKLLKQYLVKREIFGLQKA
jgi:RNA polymerase sigma-70 factor (ECF subfamily)